MICAGGGGIPTMYDEHGKLHGIEAVIDKDLASALLAERARGGPARHRHRRRRRLHRLGYARAAPPRPGHPRRARAALDLPAGSMGPKVRGGLPVRPRHRQRGGDRLAGRHRRDRRRLGRHPGLPRSRLTWPPLGSPAPPTHASGAPGTPPRLILRPAAGPRGVPWARPAGGVPASRQTRSGGELSGSRPPARGRLLADTRPLPTTTSAGSGWPTSSPSSAPS